MKNFPTYLEFELMTSQRIGRIEERPLNLPKKGKNYLEMQMVVDKTCRPT